MHGLSSREARLLIAVMTAEEKSVALVWRQGDPLWRHLHHPGAKELLKSEAPVDVTPPPLPFTPIHIDENTAVRVQQPGRTWNREHERFDAEIPAEVLLGSQRHRTLTENLSVGGLKFKNRLPDWVAGYFTVILNRPEGSLEITCMLVEDQKDDKTRVAVVETEDPESHLPLYQAWVRGHDQ